MPAGQHSDSDSTLRPLPKSSITWFGGIFARLPPLAAGLSPLPLHLPPSHVHIRHDNMIYDNMICKYCSVHGTSPQLAEADCCHTYTHKQSLRTHVHTPSVSPKTCPYPFSLSQNMSIPLQSLTKHVHSPSVSHNTCPDPFSFSHNTFPYRFSLSQNMSTPVQSLTKHVHTTPVSHNTCPESRPLSLSQHQTPSMKLTE